MLQPWIVGEAHYQCAQRVKAQLQRYNQLQDIIAILGLDGLFDEENEQSLLYDWGIKIARNEWPDSTQIGSGCHIGPTQQAWVGRVSLLR